LFTIPRSILLSTRTSTLPQKLGIQEWKARKLDIDWSGLILCMMWEDAQSADSVWFEYLGVSLLLLIQYNANLAAFRNLTVHVCHAYVLGPR